MSLLLGKRLAYNSRIQRISISFVMFRQSYELDVILASGRSSECQGIVRIAANQGAIRSLFHLVPLNCAYVVSSLKFQGSQSTSVADCCGVALLRNADRCARLTVQAAATIKRGGSGLRIARLRNTGCGRVWTALQWAVGVRVCE